MLGAALTAHAAPARAAVTLRGLIYDDNPRGPWLERYTEARQGPEQVDKVTQTIKVGDGAVLDLSHLAGDVRVTGGSGSEIKIDATKRVRHRDAAEGKRLLDLLRVDINNFNNRVEEAIGNAHDFWRAYQEKAFDTAVKPFLGYIMLLEHDEASTRPVREHEPHFKDRAEYKNASYARRYELFCEKAFREGLYDATAFLMSEKDSGLEGEYIEPSKELSFKNLAATLYGRAVAYSKQQGNG